ncbi:MAG TPA: indolepyruvate oxidoreductase subunit beta [Dehalococcoidia bacterium]|nr:indolepyruvate oxidoreductase subunit beta [Dehalococcoidia bacterium]
MKAQNILMVGVGGQGTVLASDMLGETAIAAGCDVKKTDTLGMAQRGGSVVSHVRVADRVWSPLIKEGEADILVAFEKLEAVRWSCYLRADGVALVNNQAVPPLSVSLGVHRYPDDEEVVESLRKWTDRIYFVDAVGKARELGDVRTANMFMLGCLSQFMPFDTQIWKDCISRRLPPDILRINLAAFDRGREEISSVGLR